MGHRAELNLRVSLSVFTICSLWAFFFYCSFVTDYCVKSHYKNKKNKDTTLIIYYLSVPASGYAAVPNGQKKN